MARARRPGRLVLGMAIAAALLIWPLARHTIDLDAAPSPTARDRALHLVRAVRSAQATYRSVHGYYDRLECLVQDSCVPNPYPPTYLAPEATRSDAYGYRLRLLEGPRARVETTEFVSPTGMTAFAFVAVPTGGERSGRRSSFCADADGINEYADGRPPRVHEGRCLDPGDRVP